MSNELPLVSIILPTFNRASVISRAIDSVFNQTYSNYELIVIDDGSIDETQEIITKYGNRLKYIKQDNRGVSAARNAGIRVSKGEYIAFIDSDDKWLPSKLDEQVAFFKLHDADDLSIVCTDANLFDINGLPHEKRRFIPKTSSCILNVVDIFRDPYLGLPTVMIKASLVDKNHVFDESLASAEDIDLYLRMTVNRNAGYIHKKLVDVHQSNNSLSESISSYDDNINVITRFLNSNHELFSGHTNEINDLMHHVHLDYAKTLLWKGYKKESREQILLALSFLFSMSAILLYFKSYLK